MNLTDIRIALFSSIAIGFNALAIDKILSITLTILAIGYTATRWYFLWKNKGKGKE